MLEELSSHRGRLETIGVVLNALPAKALHILLIAGISHSALKRDLSYLQERGLIRRVYLGKESKYVSWEYFLTEKGYEALKAYRAYCKLIG